jgi:mono/diheme cytochrome c family protein
LRLRPVPAFALFLSGLLACLLSLGACDAFVSRTPGEKIWRQRCAECHGLDGAGNTPRYMGNPYADLLDDGWRTGGDRYSIENVVREGVFGKMPAAGDLTAEEMRDLLAHLAHLRGETAK